MAYHEAVHVKAVNRDASDFGCGSDRSGIRPFQSNPALANFWRYLADDNIWQHFSEL